MAPLNGALISFVYIGCVLSDLIQGDVVHLIRGLKPFIRYTRRYIVRHGKPRLCICWCILSTASRACVQHILFLGGVGGFLLVWDFLGCWSAPRAGPSTAGRAAGASRAPEDGASAGSSELLHIFAYMFWSERPYTFSSKSLISF